MNSNLFTCLRKTAGTRQVQKRQLELVQVNKGEWRDSWRTGPSLAVNLQDVVLWVLDKMVRTSSWSEIPTSVFVGSRECIPGK